MSYKVCDLPAQPVPDWLDYDMWLGPAPWRPLQRGLRRRLDGAIATSPAAR